MALGSDGRVRVLLITSRETRRWVVPKGWAEPGVTPPEQAAREAFEEAGLEGVITPTPLGSYRYDKQRRAGRPIPVTVDVYPLTVLRQRNEWPEKGQRDLLWVAPEEAAEMVAEPGLAAILLALAGIGPSPGPFAGERVRPTA
jgi:8-oxo-dGTP pyrophosphatase MutT (NUDIX family)